MPKAKRKKPETQAEYTMIGLEAQIREWEASLCTTCGFEQGGGIPYCMPCCDAVGVVSIFKHKQHSGGSRGA